MNVNGLIGTSGLSTSHAADSLTAHHSLPCTLTVVKAAAFQSLGARKKKTVKKKKEKKNTKQNYPVLKVPGTFLW